MNAAKLRTLADKAQADADVKRRPSLDNTPKRAMQAASNRIEADRLERTAKGLRALADAAEALAVPPILQGVSTRKAVYELVGNKLDHPSYYRLIDTGEPSVKTPEALALRALIEDKTSPEESAERERVNRIADMESKIRFVKIPGFYPTPAPLIARLLELAEVNPTHKVLEPSAGKGDIVDAVKAIGAEVVACEIVPALCDILAAKGHQHVSGDFIERFSITDPQDLIGYVEPHMAAWDRIIMNPPFEGMQDIAHIQHAYKLLKTGGRLVTLMSPSAWFRQDKRAMQFREWFETVEGQQYDAPSGSFASGFAPTGAEVRIVVIDK